MKILNLVESLNDMLNKEVCNKCWELFFGDKNAIAVFDGIWKCHRFINRPDAIKRNLTMAFGRVKETDDPPEYCHYILEHLLTGQKDVK